MTLHISEAEVRSVLTMSSALDAVEEVSLREAAGEVTIHSRQRFKLPGGYFHFMAAADVVAGLVATKQYTWVSGSLRFLVSLYEAASGDLLVLMEGDSLGRLRTGAATGVATKYLARDDASVAAIIGTGGQARTQIEAIAAVRRLSSVRAYGRSATKLQKFCDEMSARIAVPVQAAASVAEAVRDADIVTTATTSIHPVVSGVDLAKGVHLNAIGANHAHKREFDSDAVTTADVIVVDSVEQSRQEAGDLILAFGGDESRWDGVKRLCDVIAGKATGRGNSADVTLFKSNGIASWDLAVAARVYALAKGRGLGRELPLWKEHLGNNE
ncbi:MAG: ornithine cyclodeaminase [Candidatus Acidiferrum sp.]